MPPVLLAASRICKSEVRLPPNKRLRSNICDEPCSVDRRCPGMATSVPRSSTEMDTCWRATSQRQEEVRILTLAEPGQNLNSSQHEKSGSCSCSKIGDIYPTTTTAATALPRPDSKPAVKVTIGTDTRTGCGFHIESENADSEKLFHVRSLGFKSCRVAVESFCSTKCLLSSQSLVMCLIPLHIKDVVNTQWIDLQSRT